MIKLGKWTPDLPVKANTVYSAKNVLPGRGTYEPFPSLSPNSSALGTRCTGAIAAQAAEGTNYVYAADGSGIYQLADGAWSSLKAGLTPDNFTEFVQWGDSVISVNGYVDKPQKMALGGVAFSDITDAPKAKHVAVVRDFVMVGDIVDHPNRVQWSAINDSDTWSGSNNQSDFQDFPDGGRVQRIIGGEYGIVFQERTIRRLTYVGSPIIFDVDDLEPGRGTLAPASVAQHGNLIFYYGLDGFYAFNGQNSVPIGFQKIDDWFAENSQPDQRKYMTGAVDPITGRVFWSFAKTGSEINDCTLIYDIRADSWTFAEVGAQQLYSTRTTGVTLEGLDALYATVEEIPASLDSEIFQGGLFYMAGFSSINKHAHFTGAPMAAEIETGELRFSKGRSARLRGLEPILEGECSIQVGYRQNTQANIVWSPDRAVNSRGVCDFNIEARYHRARIKPTGDWSTLEGLEVVASERGRR